MKLKLIVLFLLICGITEAEKPVVQWAKSAGVSGNQYTQSVVVDNNDNVIVTGYFMSPSISFGTYNLTNFNVGEAHVFIVKYDSAGNVLWAKSTGDSDIGYVLSCTVDATGNIYICGFFKSNTLTIGPYVLTNDYAGTYGKLFYAKYDASGNVVWAKNSINTNRSNAMNAICSDKLGNIYATGHYQDASITLGTVTLTNSSDTYQDVFLLKMDASGNTIWAKSFGGSNHDVGNSVAVDQEGNVFVTGNFRSPSIKLESTVLTNILSPSNDIFTAKYNSAGNLLWAKSAGSTSNDYATSVTVDNLGNPYIGGYYTGDPFTIGNFNLKLSSPTTLDLFIAKYSKNGNVEWAKTASKVSKTASVINSVYADNKSNVYATGSFSGATIFFDTITLKPDFPNNTNNIFLVKYDSLGIEIWAKCYAGLGFSEGKSVFADKKRNVYLTGSFASETIKFDTITLKNDLRNVDVFITKIGLDTTRNNYEVNFCASDLKITLTAPANNKYYTWLDSKDNLIGNGQSVTITNPVDSAVYSCKFKNSIDSTIINTYTLIKYASKADFSFSLQDCKTNTIQFTNLSSGKQGTLTYLWDFGDGETSIEKDPKHKYVADVVHYVSLTITNPPSICTNTISKPITYITKLSVNITGDSTFCKGGNVTLKAHGAASYKWSNGATADSITVTSTHKVWVVGYSISGCASDTVFQKVRNVTSTVSITGNATYCPNLSVTLNAHGANRYEWSDGSTTDSIKVSAESTVWLLGYTSSCVSDTAKFKVIQEPDWTFGADGNLEFCTGDSTTFTASGAQLYHWNNGKTTNSINVRNSGNYTVIGVNKRGCKKSLTLLAIKKAIPIVEFSVSSPSIDSRHNKVTCTATALSGVEYKWDMGDGTFESGTQIEHTYAVSNAIYEYNITLTTTNLTGCTSTVSKTVDVTLFIPNVFTPNADEEIGRAHV